MNEDFKEFDELLKGFVEGSLNESEQKRFEETLKADSAARQRYLDYIDVESMLGCHRLKVENAQPLQEKSKLKVSPGTTSKVRRSKAKSRNSGAFLILAASLFLALSLGYYMKFVKKPDKVSSVETPLSKFLAIVENSSAGAQVIIAGKTQPAEEGLELFSDAEISSGNSANLVLRLGDGSSLKLAPSSKLDFSQSNGQVKLTLKGGFLRADVNKQPAGKPLLVFTAEAKMKVLGTVLRINKGLNSTTLTVDEGRVEIQNSQHLKVIVKSGESVTAQPENSLKV